MNITQENTGNLTALLTVKIVKEDYSPKVDNVVKDLTKKVHIKGFRKGKVPSGVIKNMYGNDILADELNKIVQEELNKYLKENKISILGQPIPKDDNKVTPDIKQAQDYEFMYELGLSPDIEVKALSPKTKFIKNIIAIDNKVLEEEVGRIAKQHGDVSHPNDIIEGDVLQLQLTELDKNDAIKEDGLNKNVPIATDMLTSKWEKEVVKLKKGAEINVPIFKFFERDKEDVAKQILGIHEDQIKEVNPNFKMKIEEISRVKKTEVNQELFDKVYGKDNVKSLEEFKGKLKEDLKKYYDVQSDRILNTEIVNKLIEDTKVPLPDDFLTKWIKITNKEEISEEEITREYKDFSKSLRWMLITSKVAKDNDIKVEHEEVLGQIRKSILEQFGMNAGAFPEEQLTEFVDKFAQNEEQYRKAYDNLLDEKLFTYMKSVFAIKDKEVTLDKFKDIAKNIHKKPKSRFKLF